MFIFFDAVICLLGLHLQERIWNGDWYFSTQVIIVILLEIFMLISAKIWKQPTCPEAGELLIKLWHINVSEQFAVLNLNIHFNTFLMAWYYLILYRKIILYRMWSHSANAYTHTRAHTRAPYTKHWKATGWNTNNACYSMPERLLATLIFPFIKNWAIMNLKYKKILSWHIWSTVNPCHHFSK